VNEDDNFERFETSYREGNPPWDSGIVPPEVVALVEGRSPLQPGRALDVGCGPGTSSIYLAQHGWQVTGVDFIPAAIRQAQQRARQANLGADVLYFLQADVTAADFLSEHPPVTLWLDIGCLHSLDPSVRRTYAAHARRLVAPQGTLLLYGWGYVEMEGRWHGFDEPEIRTLFTPAFELLYAYWGEEATAVDRPSAWYRLRRSSP